MARETARASGRRRRIWSKRAFKTAYKVQRSGFSDQQQLVAPFLRALLDPCAERGEFHTVAYAGPMFREAIPVENGEVVEQDGFIFADVRLRTAN